MFKVLPITIMALAGFTVFKGVNYADETGAADIAAFDEPKTEYQVSLEEEIINDLRKADEMIGNQIGSLELFEPAAGDEEEKSEEKAEAEKPECKEGEEGDHCVKVLPSNVSLEKPEEKFHYFTETEREILEKLAKRRKELESWEAELQLKANLVEASSKKMEEKIAELERLKKVTEELLTAYQKEEESKMASLVKMYESMKPKQAAAIFNELKMNILLEIVDQMSSRRAAPILAKMNPGTAKKVTEQLAEQRRLAEALGVRQ